MDDLKDWRPHAAKMRADLCGQLPNGVGNTIDALIEQITELERQLAARDARLANIAALARKRQAVCGPDGNWASVEGFAAIESSTNKGNGA